MPDTYVTQAMSLTVLLTGFPEGWEEQGASCPARLSPPLPLPSSGYSLGLKLPITGICINYGPQASLGTLDCLLPASL